MNRSVVSKRDDVQAGGQVHVVGGRGSCAYCARWGRGVLRSLQRAGVTKFLFRQRHTVTEHFRGCSQLIQEM
jgi:hypothetical protein